MKQYFPKQLLVQLFMGIVPMELHVSTMQEGVHPMMVLLVMRRLMQRYVE
jgi:hypothetical protein